MIDMLDHGPCSNKDIYVYYYLCERTWERIRLTQLVLEESMKKGFVEGWENLDEREKGLGGMCWKGVGSSE